MKVEPVAYLKTWTRDGEERKRVDICPEPDAWMDSFKATPLHAIRPGYALVRVEQVKDAERWQAFLNCGRVKLFGWAGVNKKPGEPSYNEVGYVHFGGEFWTNAFEEKHYSAEAKAEAQKVLIAFADGAIKTAMLTAAAKGE